MEKENEKKESALYFYKIEDIKSELISEVISEVDSRGSLKSKMPSTIKMSVGHRFAHEAQNIMLDLKEGITPEKGLIGLRLIAVYAEGEIEIEKIVDDMNLELDEAGETK